MATIDAEVVQKTVAIGVVAVFGVALAVCLAFGLAIWVALLVSVLLGLFIGGGVSALIGLGLATKDD